MKIKVDKNLTRLKTSFTDVISKSSEMVMGAAKDSLTRINRADIASKIKIEKSSNNKDVSIYVSHADASQIEFGTQTNNARPFMFSSLISVRKSFSKNIADKIKRVIAHS